MASRFETFSEDEICAINEAVVQTNTKKATNFGLSVFTGRPVEKYFHAELATKLWNALDKILKMGVKCKQSSF